MPPGDCEMALFGLWPERCSYGDAPLEEGLLSPETKAAEVPAGVELRLLLNDMTQEMRGQFDAFRTLREASVEAIETAEDDAVGKLARADLKAAADAMSLIVRTLEKIDVLQRQMARDRRDEDERNAEPQGYDQAKQHFLDLIERRAEERAQQIFDGWVRDRALPSDGASPQGGGERGTPKDA